MRVQKTAGIEEYALDPGDYYISDKPVVIKTLLGSCVAACLYDPVTRVMAMNHFLLVDRRYKKNVSTITSDAGRYGVHAMELIINKMIKFGAKKQNIKAKAFGGGNVLYSVQNNENFFNIGTLNTEFIKEFLKTEKIPLVSSDLGGNQGRVIMFYGTDYSVYVRKIAQTETIKVAERDRSYWKSVQQQWREKGSEIELWNTN